jgi:1,2-diacylglycerol 3-alpha-glucosyltransferase
MKILMAADTYRPRVNGVVTSIDTFSAEYRKMGHEVVIIAPEYPESQKDIKDSKDQENEKYVLRLPSSYMWFDPEDRFPNLGHAKSKQIIEEKIIKGGFDIIHTHVSAVIGFAAIKWAKKIGCPVIHTYHTLFEQYVHYIKIIPKGLAVWIARFFSKVYCDKMDMVITPSTQMRETLLSYKVRKDLPVIVNPTGIKIDKFKNFSRTDFRKQHNINESTTLFLFMGRVGAEKNIPFLFKVLKKVLAKRPDTKLIVAGKGPAEEQVKQAAKDEGVFDNCIFLGYFEPQEWVNCYAAADLFTFASVTETQGLVVTEAMAVGTPVVAVGKMGVAEVMEGDKGGLLVKEDVDEFTAAVFKMLDDKKLYEAKKKEAFAYAKEWSAESMAKRMVKNYEETITRVKAAKK